MAGVASVIGPEVAEISGGEVTVAGMGEGVGGSRVDSKGLDMGALQPTTMIIIRRMAKKCDLFSNS